MRSLLCVAVLVSAFVGISCTEETPPPPPPPDPDCGNGLLEEGEECEGDPTPEGCNPNTCQVQVGFACSPEPPNTDSETGEVFEPVEWMSSCEALDTCGDGVVDPGEECDDSDLTVGDGCSNCEVDPLWTCMGEPSDCFQCGDAFLDEPFEECDDGEESDVTGMNTPGCEFCMVVEGWECFPGPEVYSVCQPLCGDGIWFDSSVEGVNFAAAEECDDGNLMNGDGCDSNCEIEDGCECGGIVEGTSMCECGVGDSGSSGGSSSDDGGSSSSGGGGSSSSSSTT